jgi:predicted nucleotidyltransferase
LLLEQPEQAYYLRQLARQIGVSPGALQHELGELQKADLIKRNQDGNRVTYRANTAHPIFTELQSIVRNTCGLPAQIKAALSQHVARIRFATLYGSMAKGLNHAGSDVDLLIVGDLSLEEALAAIVPVEARIGREISVRIYSAQDFRNRREQGESFLANVLAGPHTPLIGTPDDAREPHRQGAATRTDHLRLLDEYRRQQGVGLYDGSFVPTRAEVDELAATTVELKAYLESWLHKHRPELA